MTRIDRNNEKHSFDSLTTKKKILEIYVNEKSRNPNLENTVFTVYKEKMKSSKIMPMRISEPQP